MSKGTIPNINNKFYGSTLVEVDINSTGSLGFDEYNAVLNNVNEAVKSTRIMRADFDYQEDEPSNINSLLSGSADKIEVDDSNYTLLSHILPRYIGSKTISAKYNEYTSSGSITSIDGSYFPSWSGDQVLEYYQGNSIGKVPAIDLYSTHMVLFDKINIDGGENNIDIFHCLYLIDDQGNKVPLSYKNNNITTMQRLFRPSSKAEVIFLSNNNQNVYDNYPIIRVGVNPTDTIQFRNDRWKYNSPYLLFNTSSLLYHSNMNSWNLATSFTNASFSSSLESNGLINFKYNESVYNGLAIGSVNENIPYPAAFAHTDSLGPWFAWLYNQETGKIFEQTDLETDLKDFYFESSVQNWPTNPFLYSPSIPEDSKLLSLNSLIKKGDILNLFQYSSSSLNIGAGITNFENFPLDSYTDLNKITSYKINNIQFPGPVSNISLNPVNANIGSGWDILTSNSSGVAPLPGVNQVSFFGDGWIDSITNGGGNNLSNYLFIINKTLNSTDYSSLISQLKIGDLIKCRSISYPNDVNKQFNLMVLYNGGQYLSPDRYSLYVQVMKGQTGALLVNGSNLTDYEIFNITKFDDPYLELEPIEGSLSSSDLNVNITTNSAWSILRNVPHEQYIESQFLSGSGVGILIPDDYNPKLREILPDIISKTQIDINSLIQ